MIIQRDESGKIVPAGQKKEGVKEAPSQQAQPQQAQKILKMSYLNIMNRGYEL